MEDITPKFLHQTFNNLKTKTNMETTASSLENVFGNLTEHEKTCVTLLYPFSGNIDIDKAIEHRLRENNINAILASGLMNATYIDASRSQNGAEHVHKASQLIVEVAESCRKVSHEMFLEEEIEDEDFV
jgi:hypothetical protein